jgi:hypothetical protein
MESNDQIVWESVLAVSKLRTQSQQHRRKGPTPTKKGMDNPVLESMLATTTPNSIIIIVNE